MGEYFPEPVGWAPPLSLSFQGKAKLQRQKWLPHLDRRRLAPILNESAHLIGEEIEEELRRMLPSLPSPKVQIEFSDGSVIWDGLTTFGTAVGPVVATIDLAVYAARLTRLIVTRVVRRHIEQHYPVRRAKTTVSRPTPRVSLPISVAERCRAFLFWCAGCHPQVIRECPVDQPKYAALGGIVLSVWALATLTGGLALNLILAGRPGAVGFTLVGAFFWGWLVLCIDRAILISMRKSRASSLRARLRAELPSALPRLALAVLIALTIADPLKVRLMSPDAEPIAQVRADEALMARATSLRRLNEQRVTDLRARIASLEQSVAGPAARIETLREAYFSEMEGASRSGRYGYGPVARQKEAEYRNANGRFETHRTSTERAISELNAQVEQVRRQETEVLQQYHSTADGGYFTRRSAVRELQRRDSSVWFAGLLISLLVLVVESCPILIKLLSEAGPYDLRKAAADALSFHETELYDSAQRTVLENAQALQTQAEIDLERQYAYHSQQIRAGQVAKAWTHFDEAFVHASNSTVNDLRRDLDHRIFRNRDS